METLSSRLDDQSEKFKQNRAAMTAHVERLAAALQAAAEGGPEQYRKRHTKAGKQLAHERVAQVLDPGTELLELMPLAGWGKKGIVPGASIIGGIGTVADRRCIIIANVPTIKGGALNPYSVRKLRRLARIAADNRLPVIYLVESAGADLPLQKDIYNYGGAEFRDIARRSSEGIPPIAVVFGSSTAGGAYIPGLADFVVMVEDQARVYLAGPPLVKMALGEDVDDEELGGAAMHASVSGSADFLVPDETAAIAKARELVTLFPDPPVLQKPAVKEPRFSAESLLGVVPEDLRQPFDPREVIARIADDSRFCEFKPLYGKTLVTGWSRVNGQRVGILANRGALLSDSANKGCHFIQLCNQLRMPLLFLQNIPGFMVGKDAERGGIIKNGAKLINAVSNSSVPAVTVIMGASYGAGNYAMCGLAYEPDFLFTWPSAKLAVMGGEQLAGVLEIIAREKQARSGGKIDEDAAQAAAQALRDQVEQESDAFFCTGEVWDDGIIDPRRTRAVVGECLELLAARKYDGPGGYGVFRM